jgi:exopolysaccharide production protein ExoZ
MGFARIIIDAFSLNSKGNRLESMEGMRGIAVILVFFVHYNSLILPWLSHDSMAYLLLPILTNIGHSGVDLFFILSGYLIYASLSRQTEFSWSKYIEARGRRIYPTFLVVLGAYLLLIIVGAQAGRNYDLSSISLALNALLMAPLFNYQPIVTVSWTLTYEVVFYLVAPLVMVSCSMRRLSREMRLLVLSSLLVIGLIWFSSMPGPERVLFFVCGMLVFELKANNDKARYQRVLTYGGLFFGLAAVAVGRSYSWPLMSYTTMLMIGLSVFVFVGLNKGSSLLSWPPLRKLGNMSYSYYLSHSLGIHAMFLLLEKISAPKALFYSMEYLAGVALVFTFTILFSIALFATVESPFSLTKKQREPSIPKSSGAFRTDR